ncbi:hypothetical protein [Microbacterium stercoris]|uniref:Uncharacterized protein n=1 Tax=Microbacterium stercoris TaxID=2820289 RepID=A0A939QL59_9MICO|nr:hypothetical protein [Microbacterium stercoris]MBO3663702.1 hypothetical protein [Microbacterium stercoris]
MIEHEGPVVTHTVELDESGALRIAELQDGQQVGAVTMAASVVDEIRRILDAERDEQLGRWRWPENPDYVVYPRENGSVTVFEESNPTAALTFWKHVRNAEVTSGAFMEAARAFFEAHPEPKPWHDAKPGELWAITFHGVERPCRAINPTFSDRELGFLPVDIPMQTWFAADAPGITAGRPIWQGAAS